MRPYGPTVLRLCLGALFIAHGVEQLFRVWGGGLGPLSETVASFGLRPVYPIAAAVAAAELAAGVLLVLGAYTLWITLTAAGARGALFYKAYIATGLLSTSPSRPLRDEVELAVLVIGVLITLAITGPGAFSLDERRAHTAERAAAGRARLRAGKG